MANNVYPLCGPRYIRFIPCDPKNSKPRWLPWGRKPPQVLSLGGGESESYFRAREAAVRANDEHHRPGDASYPRIIAPIMKEDI